MFTDFLEAETKEFQTRVRARNEAGEPDYATEGAKGEDGRDRASIPLGVLQGAETPRRGEEQYRDASYRQRVAEIGQTVEDTPARKDGGQSGQQQPRRKGARHSHRFASMTLIAAKRKKYVMDR